MSRAITHCVSQHLCDASVLTPNGQFTPSSVDIGAVEATQRIEGLLASSSMEAAVWVAMSPLSTGGELQEHWDIYIGENDS